MACNENVIKNIASEICRECLAKSVTVEIDFVQYIVQLLLLNPKYGKLFSKSLNRVNLEYFVHECVTLLSHGDVPVKVLKMQHVLDNNYDEPQKLISNHLDNITVCLRPLLIEIVETYPDVADTPAYEKLLRKISIYIILASGLGNPAFITTLKEGMSALESVFSMSDLKEYVVLERSDKILHLEQLVSIVSGCRLFNRDCKKGGEGIPDLPFNLADASNACVHSISNILLRIMERVNSLTSAIDEQIGIDESQRVTVNPLEGTDMKVEDYQVIFNILVFYRQYELIVRRLLSDVETIVHYSKLYIDKLRETLQELHGVVKYRAAVPVLQVFPYFTSLWNLWRLMQNEMYLVSTINQLMNKLEYIQDSVIIPSSTLDTMLTGKCVMSDQERLNKRVSVSRQLSLAILPHYVGYESAMSSKGSLTKERESQYLGFCAMSLCVGALIPGNPKVGFIKWKGKYYSFSTPEFAVQFGKDPQNYIQEVLELARLNPCLIHLLGLIDDVYRVRNIDCLITREEPKTKLVDQGSQTETHPIAEKIVKDYSWNLWEYKRIACHWSNIVKCQTHSTQTDLSHMRSEIQCQTTEPRDKGIMTRRNNGTNVPTINQFLWGLRGRLDDKQHAWNLTLPPS